MSYNHFIVYVNILVQYPPATGGKMPEIALVLGSCIREPQEKCQISRCVFPLFFSSDLAEYFLRQNNSVKTMWIIK